jgi:hypothetical protein
MKEGLRWARGVWHNILLLIGLALLTTGVTVVGVLLHKPGWFLGVFGVVVLLLVLVKGAYRVHEADTHPAAPASGPVAVVLEFAALTKAIEAGYAAQIIVKLERGGAEPALENLALAVREQLRELEERAEPEQHPATE